MMCLWIISANCEECKNVRTAIDPIINSKKENIPIHNKCRPIVGAFPRCPSTKTK